MDALPRMRTIKAAVTEIKTADSKTAVTEWRIRQLINEGVLPCVKAGKRFYINLDLLISYLNNPLDERFTKPVAEGVRAVNGIRKVE